MPESVSTIWSFFTHFERILNFSDGVFAIAITLMVLSLSIPSLTGSSSGSGLPTRLLAEWPAFFAYLISFLVIGGWWMYHHRNFQYLTGYNSYLLWLNLLFLLCITLTPCLTSLLVIYHDSVFVNSLYAAFQVTAALIMFIMWKYSTDQYRFVDPSISPVLVRYITYGGIITIFSFLISIPIAIISPLAAEISWVIIPLFTRTLTDQAVKRQNVQDNDEYHE